MLHNLKHSNANARLHAATHQLLHADTFQFYDMCIRLLVNYCTQLTAPYEATMF